MLKHWSYVFLALTHRCVLLSKLAKMFAAPCFNSHKSSQLLHGYKKTCMNQYLLKPAWILYLTNNKIWLTLIWARCCMCNLSKGHVTLVATIGTTILVPYHWVKSLQLIGRSGTRRWNLRVPDLPMSCGDWNTWQGTRIVARAMAAEWHAPLYFDDKQVSGHIPTRSLLWIPRRVILMPVISSLILNLNIWSCLDETKIYLYFLWFCITEMVQYFTFGLSLWCSVYFFSLLQ